MRSKYLLIEQIKDNPLVFCFNNCCNIECPKHKDNVDLGIPYLYALMKDTPYCPYDERKSEDYE